MLDDEDSYLRMACNIREGYEWLVHARGLSRGARWYPGPADESGNNGQ